MGDRRYDAAYRAVAEAPDRSAAIRDLRHEEVVQALAAASKRMDAYLANVLAVEVLNRYRRQRAALGGAVAGLSTAVALRTFLLVKAEVGARTPFDAALLWTSLGALIPAFLVGLAVMAWLLRRP